MKNSESHIWKYLLAVALVCSLLPHLANAQATAAGAGSSGTASASAGAPSGSGAVENVIISSQATSELAKELAHRMCTDKVMQYGRSFLLGTPPNLAAIQSYLTFKTAVDQLSAEYNKLGASPPGGPPAAAAHLSISPGASQAIGDIAQAVGVIKTQTTQTASIFTPVDQVLFSDLERELNTLSGGCDIVTMVYPNQIAGAASDIETTLNSLLEKRLKAQRTRHSDTDSGYTADKELQGLDAELVTLEQTLGNESPNVTGSNILIGRALLTALTRYGDSYHVLTLVNAGSGGGIRSNVYFLLNVLIPAPHSSYNGGAVVSYSLRTMAGAYESADTLYFVFGYTKWKQPPLRKNNQRGFANFDWDDSQNKGHWQPIY